MTTLSVIVPMRDVAPYLGNLLLSLTHNDRGDFEFIAVDDGSVDATPQILAEHALRMPNFRVLRNDEAVGLSGARNRGMAASSGRYITFLDGDDWLAPGYLAQAVAAIEELGCDFVRTDHIQVFGRRREVHRAPMGRRGVKLDPRDGILPMHTKTMVDYPYAWAGLYRRELFEDGLLRFDEELLTAEDRPWIWRLHRRASSYAVVSLSGVFYRRQVANSLSQVGDRRQLHFFDAFDKVLDELAGDPDRDRLILKAVQNYCAIIAHHLNERERLTPALRHTLRTRARERLRTFPPDVLAAVRPGVGKERLDLFATTLGIGI
ncbi:glycosyltransferase family 2 protein [Thermomonospora cellulosilytica]|uniref:Glycosyltransferase involved in cell wall biosynthesis n=1 Tax=Thermomonospora cellulosilytica TaxID=1411118 RepID=A0A7W3N5L1_9ACTN|nr:glycosyltransferase family 2 protein [Thermomonospora cellulosilytica]MBA9007955.1 glycosyltransferase involved in cell wall biosynthesis [Thermomonospora cellulosilytica]